MLNFAAFGPPYCKSMFILNFSIPHSNSWSSTVVPPLGMHVHPTTGDRIFMHRGSPNIQLQSSHAASNDMHLLCHLPEIHCSLPRGPQRLPTIKTSILRTFLSFLDCPDCPTKHRAAIQTAVTLHLEAKCFTRASRIRGSSCSASHKLLYCTFWI